MAKLFSGGESGDTKNIQSSIAIKDENREGSVCSLLLNGKEQTDNLYLLSVNGSGEVNIQIDVNFDNALFVTVFGEKLTALTFRGLVSPSNCPDGNLGNSIIDFYNKRKAGASSKIDVIAVAYNAGDFIFKGILTKMTLNPYTGAGPDAFTFDMTLQGRVMSKQV
jgi:hypothetical protein